MRAVSRNSRGELERLIAGERSVHDAAYASPSRGAADVSTRAST
jgi:Zn-finger nucleic acid-binding protein